MVINKMKKQKPAKKKNKKVIKKKAVVKVPIIPFEFLSHTADIKFRAYGKSLEEAFVNCAMAVKETITKSNVSATITKGCGMMADDLEGLLQNFLEEIIFLFDSENFIISRVEKIRIIKDDNGFSLSCDFAGDVTDGKDLEGKSYDFEEHIKAITYHEMSIKKTNNGSYEIEVVLDV